MKRPLVVYFFSFILGFLISYLFHILHINSSFLLIPTLLGLLITILILIQIIKDGFGNKDIFSKILYLFLPILSLIGMYSMKNALLIHPLHNIFESKVEARIEGEISSLEIREEYSILYTINNKITIDNKSYHSDKLRITTTEKNIKPGDVIGIEGNVIKFTKATNFGQFDEEIYYRIRKVDFKVKADKIEILATKVYSYKRTLYVLKTKLLDTYKKLLPRTESGIMSAMILGESYLLEDEIKELYNKSGISHILAISGLHISMIGNSIYFLLRKLRIPNFLVTMLSIFLMISYGVLTNFSVSTNRSIIMFICLLLGKLIGRTYDLISGIFLSAFIILMMSPFELINPGFLLSYGAMFSIAILVPFFQQLYGKKLKTEKENGIYQAKYYLKIKNEIINAVILSGGAQLGLLPILLYFFFEFSLYSVLINILILPLSTLLLLLGLLSGIGGMINIYLGELFVGFAYYILKIYEAICQVAETLPYAQILVGRPSIYAILLYYIGIACFLFFNHKKEFRKKTLLLCLLLVFIFLPMQKELEVTLLDVGQGDGIALHYKNKINILVDGGSTSVGEVGTYRIIPYLKAKGVNKIDYAFITHYDQDHISGVLELLDGMEKEYIGKGDIKEKAQNIEKENVNLDMKKFVKSYSGNIEIETLVLPYYEREEEIAKSLIKRAMNLGIQVVTISKGDKIIHGDLEIECIYPTKSTVPNTSNNISTVLDLKYKNFDMLLTGDIESKGEKLLESEIKHAYEVLKVAHHGSNSSTSKELLSKIQPKISIISAGVNNRYGHPHKDLVDRLNEIGSNIIATNEVGAIYISTDGENVRIE